MEIVILQVQQHKLFTYPVFTGFADIITENENSIIVRLHIENIKEFKRKKAKT